ncbi:MAG: hypothetical protein V4467_01680 [Patescibacteria group bacterium]
MFDTLLQYLVSKWGVENALPPEAPPIDFFIGISYGMTRTNLTVATERITRLTAEMARAQQAPIIISCCEYLFRGAAFSEWQLRHRIFETFRVRYYRAGDMNNSMQESRQILKCVSEHGLPTRHIGIVTGIGHSRFVSERYGKLFPNSKITITCVPFDSEYQPDHPAWIQRGPWRWLFAHVARQILYHVRGEKMADMQHWVPKA